MSFLRFLLENQHELLELTLQHLSMVLISIASASVIGIPAGILIARRPGFEKGILGFANVVQTIPSLALFGFLIPVPVIGGIGARTAIFALTLYALLPIIRNTFVGIESVDEAIKEAGRGMGMTENQLLWRVEIPLATGVIVAGIRVAAITSVGIATIAAAIGGGGLGAFIFRGVASVNTNLILAGAVPAAILALLSDFALGRLEKRLRMPSSGGRKRR
ncbi:MAG: ABC transporter permease [Acidobacteriota bacterium]